MPSDSMTAELVHGTVKWYDREIEAAQERLWDARMQVARAETALAIFTQERTLAAARKAALSVPDEGGNHAGDGQHGGDSTG